MTEIQSSAIVSSNGRVVIPAEMRKLLGLKDNDKVIFRYENGDLKISSQQQALLKAQSFFANSRKSSVSETDKFLKSRKKLWDDK